ncbi:arsenate reductase (glutaredoxin) [Roseovarius sp. 2305UL8-3]|uniref:arsenate reductase (glutaredoxin) n=1 Tax=Roseovarius conchicola TaxID=3121636 RepID=UPI0035298350
MITIWHNPRCSKSRQTHELLIREGHDPVERRYQDNPPSEAELRAAQTALGLPAIAMMRTGEAAFKEMGLSKTDDEATLIAAMAKEPKLIERPIVFNGSRAIIGRPPEAVLDIL